MKAYLLDLPTAIICLMLSILRNCLLTISQLMFNTNWPVKVYLLDLPTAVICLMLQHTIGVDTTWDKLGQTDSEF